MHKMNKRKRKKRNTKGKLNITILISRIGKMADGRSLRGQGRIHKEDEEGRLIMHH